MDRAKRRVQDRVQTTYTDRSQAMESTLYRATCTTFAIIVTAALAASSCGGKKAKTKQLGEPSDQPDDRVLVMQGDVPDGLTMRLSDRQG